MDDKCVGGIQAIQGKAQLKILKEMLMDLRIS